MPAEVRPTRLAVLIDGDNVSHKLSARLFEAIAEIGETSVRRIYGDLFGSHLKEWKDACRKHGIIPQQNFAAAAKKNATDIALVIDAMDLLHTGRFDGFCIASGDSDFTRLAVRIREQGIKVYGLSERKASPSFKEACHRFIDLKKTVPKDVSPKRAPAIETRNADSNEELLQLLTGAFEQAKKGDMATMGELGKKVREIDPKFKEGPHSRLNLSDLVRTTDAFEIIKTGRSVHVRLKPAGKPAPKGRS